LIGVSVCISAGVDVSRKPSKQKLPQDWCNKVTNKVNTKLFNHVWI
jgi:hypothetical protein